MRGARLVRACVSVWHYIHMGLALPGAFREARRAKTAFEFWGSSFPMFLKAFKSQIEARQLLHAALRGLALFRFET